MCCAYKAAGITLLGAVLKGLSVNKTGYMGPLSVADMIVPADIHHLVALIIQFWPPKEKQGI